MKDKGFITVLFVTAAVTLIVLFGGGSLLAAMNTPVASDSVSLKQVAQTIVATGSIHSQQEATLNFQTGGKLIYLPFKEGDSVFEGQTIAQLDTYALQRELTAALNTYRSTRDSFDQTQTNSQTNVLQTQQVSNFPGIQANETNAINDAVKRLADESQAGLDNSVINVELANYTLQLASLTAPFSGVITHEDVTTPNVNVTTLTSFSIADPTEKVFRAQIGASDIDFVSVGGKATVKLDGATKSLTGTVITIYPQKQTLASGQQVYNVDIQMDNLPKTTIFGQNGTVLITSNNQTQSLMVPTWTIVGHNSIWVLDGQKAILKTIQTGQTHGDMTEIISGLVSSDKVIIAPKNIASKKYQML